MRTNRRRRLTALSGAALAFGLCAAASAQEVDATRLDCNWAGAPVKSGDGKVRLAMIVGVTNYKFHTRLLPGAVKDAGRMYSFLVDSPAKVFPTENVCVLTNAKANYQGFADAFQKALVDRAAGAEEVVIFYAGHGSALEDDGDDETDDKDETLFLYDSSPYERPSEGRQYKQLRDDDFNAMLKGLAAKAKNVAVILDSCNSGSGTRDFGEERTRAVRSDSGSATRAPIARAAEDKASFSDEPHALPNVVTLAAARDMEEAKETARGGGKFTRALLDVLTRADIDRITYDQLMGIVSAKMATISNEQNPVLSGDGSRFIFSSDIPYKPRFDWEVASSTPVKTVIRGAPTFGMGLGAEFLILPNKMTVEDAKKSDIAKARMKATKKHSFNVWELTPIETFRPDPIEPKDYAQLVRPSSEARQLRLRLRPANEVGGIFDPAAFAEMMKTPIKTAFRVPGAVGADSLVTFEAPGYDFEISRNRAGLLQISDAAGLQRNILPKPVDGGANERTALARALSNHFQQLSLLADWRPSGGSLTPNRSLEVSLVPYLKGDRIGAKTCEDRPAVTRSDWPKAANAPQRVPACAFFQIKVKLAEDAPISLRIAASVLSADGQMLAYPRVFDPAKPNDMSIVDEGGIELGKGDEVILRGVPQADVESVGKPEYVYVLGLPAEAQGSGAAAEAAYTIPWHLLSTPKERTRDGTTRPEEINKREYGTYAILRFVTVED